MPGRYLSAGGAPEKPGNQADRREKDQPAVVVKKEGLLTTRADLGWAGVMTSSAFSLGGGWAGQRLFELAIGVDAPAVPPVESCRLQMFLGSCHATNSADPGLGCMASQILFNWRVVESEWGWWCGKKRPKVLSLSEAQEKTGQGRASRGIESARKAGERKGNKENERKKIRERTRGS